jgi:hypothetical protein
MTTEHLTRQECTEAARQAQRIQKIINSTIGRQFARCSAPIRFKPRDLPHAEQDLRCGLDLRIEPLEMTTDFRDQPDGKIAARLREWSKLLSQAADSLE